jgi:hypothetical protein
MESFHDKVVTDLYSCGRRRSVVRRASECSLEKHDREHLRSKNAQERGKRIDGGVGDHWRVGVRNVRGEGECRRIGHAASQQAAEVHEVHLQHDACEDAYDE